MKTQDQSHRDFASRTRMYTLALAVALMMTGHATGQVFVKQTNSLPDVWLGSVTMSDYDGDGYLDVLIAASDTGNDPPHPFTRLDHNGNPDILAASMEGSTLARVFRNNGNGTFTDINAPLEGVADGRYGSWGDYHHDGKLDILLTGFYLDQVGPISRVFHNDGSGKFTDLGADLLPLNHGYSAWGDLDNDGKLDLILIGTSDDPLNRFTTGNFRTVVYRNTTRSPSTVNPGGCVTAPAGLIGWWPGDGTTNDLQSTHPGVLKNGASFSAGQVGQSFSLDGVDDYVDLGAWNAGSQWTIEAWVKPSATPSGRRSIAGGLNEYRDWAITLLDGQFGVAIRTPGGGADTVRSGVQAAAGNWYHVVGTRDGTTARIYLDGELKGSAVEDTYYVGTATGTWIGGENWNGGNNFPGLVDEVSIYNRALSASEIQSIFNAGRAGKCKSTPVITSALTASGQVGVAFNYQIIASNNPTKYAATRLPAGLSVNPATGLISGTPTVAGTNTVNLSAANAGGTTTTTLTLIIPPQVPSGTGEVSVAVKIRAVNTGAVVSWPATAQNYVLQSADQLPAAAEA